MKTSCVTFLLLLPLWGVDADVSARDAEITSQLLQLDKGGALTRFFGDVRLTQKTQWLEADRMTRSRLTGIAEAEGNVRGTWFSQKGEKIYVTGVRARYSPLAQTTELWGDAPLSQLTRWETAVDTSPVVIRSQYFMARQKSNDVSAKGSVVITQAPRFEAHSDEARYDRTAGVLEMWGRQRVQIHVDDAKGRSNFESDRAWIQINPKRSRLSGNVKGRVVPRPSPS